MSTAEQHKIDPVSFRGWIEQVIEGSGGFKVWEERECVIFHWSRECGVAEFVIRCLANPNCEGSDQVLQAIIEHREKKLNKAEHQPTKSDAVEFGQWLIENFKIQYEDEVDTMCWMDMRPPFKTWATSAAYKRFLSSKKASI